MPELIKFPRVPVREIPKRMIFPAEYGLRLAVLHLCQQSGDVNTYNKLLDMAKELRECIEAGEKLPTLPAGYRVTFKS